eukprot:Hpha_TRINITY_DN11407_c0_g1::TRINITY_DN11407_c0_g1_i2::g.137662::m.137662
MWLIAVVLKLGAAAGCVTEVSAGQFHTCATIEDRDLKCWGVNVGGALGYDDIINRGDKTSSMGSGLPPVGVNVGGALGYDDIINRGDKTSSMGSGLPPVGVSVRDVRGGDGLTCGLFRSDFRPVCWGANDFGQLGTGDLVKRGAAGGQWGMAALVAVPVSLSCTVALLEVYHAHSCVVCSDKSTLYCWGWNS